MGIENFSWIIEGKLAGSAMPGGSSFATEDLITTDLEDLYKRGIRFIISSSRVPPAFGIVCRKLSLEWRSLVIEDMGIPARGPELSALLDETVAAMDAPKPVCVHCRAGIGRTGLILACIVGVYFKIPGIQAIKTVRRSRAALESFEQEQFVIDLLRDYENRI